jgi:hypothetical protein
MSDANLEVTWIDSGREAVYPPDPAYPHGTDIDVTGGQRPSCETTLPYPARRCGQYLVKCSRCGFTDSFSTAGRADDPRSVRVPCMWVKP